MDNLNKTRQPILICTTFFAPRLVITYRVFILQMDSETLCFLMRMGIPQHPMTL